MHRRTNNFNYRDIVSLDHKITRVLIPILGIATSLGLSTLLPSPSTYAAGSQLEIIVPDAAIENKATINPSAVGSSFASVYVPVGINATGISTAELFVTSSDKVHNATTDLVNTEDNDVRIATLPVPSPAPSSLSPLNYTGITKEEFINGYSYNNRWGYRATLVKADADIVSSQSTINSLAGTSSNYKATSGSILSNLSSLSSSTVINAANNKTWGSIIADTGELGDETFYPIMSHIDAEPMRSFTGTSTAGSYSGLLALELALKLDSSIPHGTYEGNIMVSAIANPRQTIFDLEYMQDMEDYICEATTTPSKDATTSNANKTATYTPGENGELGTWTISPVANFIEQQDDDSYVPETILIDKRDNKPYLIRKLADGNCWMSSNLDYNNLTDSGADVTTMIAQLQNAELTDTKSVWNGLTVHPTETVEDINWKADATKGIRTFSFKDNAALGAFVIKNANGTFSKVVTGEIYEYSGTFYNWYAATIGSYLGSGNDDKAPSSICPRGWKLPDTDGAKSWYNLFSEANYDISSNTDGSRRLGSFPLDYPRTGFYLDGQMSNQVTSGFWWTSAPLSTGAYALNLGNANVRPQASANRGDGRSIRCVAY